MPRPPSIWHREQDGFYYTKLGGRQVKLSADKAEARRLFHKLMAGDAPARSSGVTCRKLLDTYLVKTAAGKSPGRVKVQAAYFRRFCEAFGPRRPESLRPFEVNGWLDGLARLDGTRAVSGSTKSLVLSMLKAGFNWGAAEGYIPASPLKGVKKRPCAVRARALAAGDVDRVLAACRPHWRDYFAVLRLTGMRPISEAGRLTAAHLDPAGRRAVFADHKTAKKTGKPRVVYFPPEAWAVVERLAGARPAGPLFRNGVGKAVCSRGANEYLRAACGRAGVEPFQVYSLRHDFVSVALGNGVPIEVLAVLAGNSPAVIRANYSKLGDDVMAPVLAEAAARAVS